jgi:hypothetical protein
LLPPCSAPGHPLGPCASFALTPPPCCRDLAGGLLGSIIDLANFQAAPISLQGLSESNVVMLQSALTASILHHIRSQLF